MDALFAADLACLSRREFLGIARRGLLALFALPHLSRLERLTRLNDPLEEEPVRLVRATDNSVEIYDRPSFAGQLRRVYWRDLTFTVHETTIGGEQPFYNRVWYRLDEGWAHSGKLQPVRMHFNPEVADIAPPGRLAEVSVPYTDVVSNLKTPDQPRYRFYCGTTHWVTGTARDAQGKLWYKIYDDKWKNVHFARPAHFHLLETEEIAPVAAESADVKRIEVWRADQVVIAYQNDEPVMIARAATGAKFLEGDYTTPEGVYTTSRKRPSRHMVGGTDLAAPNSFDLPGVPWVCYLTLSGISFHGTFWHNDFGKPRSHGCINLSMAASRWLYRWTFPAVPFEQSTWSDDLGTYVTVR